MTGFTKLWKNDKIIIICLILTGVVSKQACKMEKEGETEHANGTNDIRISIEIFASR